MTNAITAQDVATGIGVLSNDLSGSEAFTLLGFCHDEIYFLPAFLEHYRRLGVGRFVFIDDRSTDGTRDYLARQPDVMTLHSAHRYGERVSPVDTDGLYGRDYRVGSFWRQYLFDRFGTGRWAILADLDEFAVLPPGLTFPDLAARLDPAMGDVVHGPMIDTYPRDAAALTRMRGEARFDPGDTLYYDAVKILSFGDGKWPHKIYGGARSRLFATYGISVGASRRDRLAERVRWRLLRRPPFSGNLSKSVLMHWARGDVFYSGHRTSKTSCRDILIPILHHKINGGLFRTIDWALQSNAYNNNSLGYQRLRLLIERAMRQNGSFVGAVSRPVAGYDDLEASGNALGLRNLLQRAA